MEVDVGKHSVCTVGALIVDVDGKWACKFLESITAFFRRILWRFAPACDDCVVLGLKAHRAAIIGLQQTPPCRSGAGLEYVIRQEGRRGGGGESGQDGGGEEEDEPTGQRHRLQAAGAVSAGGFWASTTKMGWHSVR